MSLGADPGSKRARSIAESVAQTLGLPLVGLRLQPLGGNTLQATWRLVVPERQAGHNLFIKTVAWAARDRLEAEADGLRALANCSPLAIPEQYGLGEVATVSEPLAWLALEWLDLKSLRGPAELALGQGLAALHARTGPHYGWHRGNWLGASPQSNSAHVSWASFFAEQRLRPQFDRAMRRWPNRGLEVHKAEVLAAWQMLAGSHQPPASLIHGDLWIGNAAALPDGRPAIFDPAVHHADRECDLAMMRLFGGFSETAFAAYEQAWPLPPGHEQRLGFYQLYHLLNHANLFGAGYLEQSLAICRQIQRRAGQA